MADKQPTALQVRHHYGKIAKLRHQLQEALNDAHNANVIRYDSKFYNEQSPCKLLYQVWERIKLTTHDQLAQAMRDEINETNRRKKR